MNHIINLGLHGLCSRAFYKYSRSIRGARPDPTPPIFPTSPTFLHLGARYSKIKKL